MGYSSLANYRNMTPHMDVGRGGYGICYIALHHTAGVISVAQCGRVFQNCETSAHYCVCDEDIGVYVDERNTSWSMGVYSYNQRCVSIEMANSTGAPNWKVSDETIETTIKLVADIAYRNGWKTIDYTGNVMGDLIVHKWVASTACPGPYVMSNNIHARIAKEANALLQKLRAGATIKTATQTVTKTAAVATDKLTIDGLFGMRSCIKMQKWLGCKYRDGVLDGQLKDMSRYIMNLEYCVDYGTGGSYTVKLLQKKLGVSADGYLGPSTIKALQSFLNRNGAKLVVDGYAGYATCEAFQSYLNNH